MNETTRPRPYARGTLLAVTAAVAFGLTVPIVGWAGTARGLGGAGLGPFTVASLLYVGAALTGFVAWLLPRLGAGAGKRLAPGLSLRPVFGRVVLVALLGAAIGPTLLAAGTVLTGATTGSLVLHLEGPFTFLLAVIFLHEPLSRHALLGTLAMVAGGILLLLDRADASTAELLGVVLVIGATVAWAADNTLSRALSERPPFLVVLAKASLGALATCTLALTFAEPAPDLLPVLVVLAAGATGYGLSLVLFLLAQRAIGAARTSALFALGPFVGATLGIVIAGEVPGAVVFVAAGLFALGLVLHMREAHQHAHEHARERHAHWHRHDDDHHLHAHVLGDGSPVLDRRRGHVHEHTHEATTHAHAHAPDLHHRHRHGAS